MGRRRLSTAWGGLFEKSGPRLRRWLGERQWPQCETARRVSGRRLGHRPNAYHHPWPNSFQKSNLSFLWKKENPQALNVSGARCFSTPYLSQLRDCPYSSARLYLINNHTAVRYAFIVRLFLLSQLFAAEPGRGSVILGWRCYSCWLCHASTECRRIWYPACPPSSHSACICAYSSLFPFREPPVLLPGTL